MDQITSYNEEYTKHSDCFQCQGYYGPCFGEPMCATCHAFLVPANPFMPDYAVFYCDCKADECDSGNEEPRESQQDCVVLTSFFDSFSQAQPPNGTEEQGLPSAANGGAAAAAVSASGATAAAGLAPSTSNGSNASNKRSSDAAKWSAILVKSPDHDDDDDSDEPLSAPVASLSKNKMNHNHHAENHSVYVPGLEEMLERMDENTRELTKMHLNLNRTENSDINPANGEVLQIPSSIFNKSAKKDSKSEDSSNEDISKFVVHSDDLPSLQTHKSKGFHSLNRSSQFCQNVCRCSTDGGTNNMLDRICLLTNYHRQSRTSTSTIAIRMPPEVLLMIFRKLDDVSLWQCSRVSWSWREMILRNWGQDNWRMFTLQRWRFFKPLYNPVHWYSLYSSLIESSPCRMCQGEMFQPLSPLKAQEEQSSWRMTRLRNENRNLVADPPEGIEAIPLDSQSLHWQAAIRGPDQSPYQGGTFYLHIIIPPRYPLGPPVVRFLTKIFHPNISCHGDIGIDSIHHNWSLALTISKVLISIQSLLTDPYTKVCMDSRAASLYENDRSKFETVAMEWTWRYAMTDALQPQPCTHELTMCEAVTGSLEDNLVAMNPLMLGVDEEEQDNNDQEQDNNDQEQDNNDQEQDNNDQEQDNNDQEQDNNDQEQDNNDPEQDINDQEQDNDQDQDQNDAVPENNVQ